MAARTVHAIRACHQACARKLAQELQALELGWRELAGALPGQDGMLLHHLVALQVRHVALQQEAGRLQQQALAQELELGALRGAAARAGSVRLTSEHAGGGASSTAGVGMVVVEDATGNAARAAEAAAGAAAEAAKEQTKVLGMVGVSPDDGKEAAAAERQASEAEGAGKRLNSQELGEDAGRVDEQQEHGAGMWPEAEEGPASAGGRPELGLDASGVDLDGLQVEAQGQKVEAEGQEGPEVEQPAGTGDGPWTGVDVACSLALGMADGVDEANVEGMQQAVEGGCSGSEANGGKQKGVGGLAVESYSSMEGGAHDVAVQASRVALESDRTTHARCLLGRK